MSKVRDYNIFLAWLTATLVYLSLQPYFVWKYAGLMNWVVNLPLYVILMFNANGKNTKYFVLFALICLLAGLVSGYSLFGIVFLFLLSTLFLTKTTFLWTVYHKFRLIYVVTIAISMIVMLLAISGVSLPSTIIEPLNALKSHNYIAFPFFVIPTDMMISGTRFCGLYDEPGVVGTTAAILLFIEKFNLKNKGNVIILISGILSVSLFFYLYISVFLLYKFFTTKISFFKRLIFVLLAICAVTLIFRNEITNELIVQRLEWNDDKQSISGNNRASGDLKDYVDSIKWTSAYFWGVRDSNILKAYSDSSSLQNAILKYGFVVLCMYFLFYLLYAKLHIGLNYRCVFFMLTIFLVMYNRPDVFNLSRNFLYIIAIYTYSNENFSVFSKEQFMRKNE